MKMSSKFAKVTPYQENCLIVKIIKPIFTLKMHRNIFAVQLLKLHLHSSIFHKLVNLIESKKLNTQM